MKGGLWVAVARNLKEKRNSGIIELVWMIQRFWN